MQLSDDAHVVIVHAGISGKTSYTEVLETAIDPVTQKERKKTRTETITENREQYDAAQSIVNALRRLTVDHCTNSPIGQLTDPKRLDLLKAERTAIEERIREHNAQPDQRHFIHHDVIILPIGRVLDEGTQQRLCEAVRDALMEGKALLTKGDTVGLYRWLQNRKNLSALMPPIVARVVDQALEALREARSKVNTLVKDFERTPENAAQEVISLGALTDVETALVWVESSTPDQTASAEVH